MDDFLRKSKSLYLEKKSSNFQTQQKIIIEQINSIVKIKENEVLEKNAVERIIQEIKSLEAHKEFNISLDGFNKLIEEKYVEENFQILFKESIDKLKLKLDELLAILLAESRKSSFDDFSFNEELKKYGEIEEIFRNINYSEEKIKQYFQDLNKLTYNKNSIRSGQIVSKIINNVILRAKIEGIENIPKTGPCILAPHHHSIESNILYAITNRPLFILACTENFMIHPLWTKFIKKLGTLPFRRDDSKYPERESGAIPKEKVDAYYSENNHSNNDSIKKILTHLNHGEAVIIYPEGDLAIKTRTYKRELGQEFLSPQEGFVSVAVLAKRMHNIDVPIIPIGVNAQKGFLNMKLNIGEPIYLDKSIYSLSNNELKEKIGAYVSMIFERIKELSK